MFLLKSISGNLSIWMTDLLLRCKNTLFGYKYKFKTTTVTKEVICYAFDMKEKTYLLGIPFRISPQVQLNPKEIITFNLSSLELSIYVFHHHKHTGVFDKEEASQNDMSSLVLTLCSLCLSCRTIIISSSNCFVRHIIMISEHKVTRTLNQMKNKYKR